MATLQYKLPSREVEAETIKNMSPKQVGKLRDDMMFRLGGLIDSCNDYFNNLIESDCHICAKFGYAYFDIPEGWGFLKDGELICNECVKRWKDRFGEEPNINRKGEIVYEHSSISKDTTHRRQANFEFV